MQNAEGKLSELKKKKKLNCLCLLYLHVSPDLSVLRGGGVRAHLAQKRKHLPLPCSHVQTQNPKWDPYTGECQPASPANIVLLDTSTRISLSERPI